MLKIYILIVKYLHIDKIFQLLYKNLESKKNKPVNSHVNKHK
jgi:hypothetical protein